MLYAKSKPEESIQEHTNRLIENLNILKKLYGYRILRDKKFNKERFFELLKLACLYHDLGKVYTPFQNMILKDLNKKELPTNLSYDYIKHEQLSPAFIPFNESNLSKEDLKPNLESDKKELDMLLEENPNNLYLSKTKNRINGDDDIYIEYCLIKGLLHRLDYTSSAHIAVESDESKSLSECTQSYLKDTFSSINELQEFAKNNENENIIVVGSTGIGKT